VRPSILLNTLVGFVMGVLVFAGVALVIENRHELHRETVFVDVGPVTAHRS